MSEFAEERLFYAPHLFNCVHCCLISMSLAANKHQIINSYPSAASDSSSWEFEDYRLHRKGSVVTQQLRDDLKFLPTCGFVNQICFQFWDPGNCRGRPKSKMQEKTNCQEKNNWFHPLCCQCLPVVLTFYENTIDILKHVTLGSGKLRGVFFTILTLCEPNHLLNNPDINLQINMLMKTLQIMITVSFWLEVKLSSCIDFKSDAWDVLRSAVNFGL